MTAVITPAQIDEMAKRIVAEDVRYCVSALVSTLAAREWDGSDGLDPDDLSAIMYRQPGADDYREAMSDRDIRDSVILQPGVGRPAIYVEPIDTAEGASWHWTTIDADNDEQGSGLCDDEAAAYRAAFDDLGEDEPDGYEVYEHWLVTSWLADKLRAQGESVADDIAGLTIWGRCTTGQAIYADGMIQRIARAILEA